MPDAIYPKLGVKYQTRSGENVQIDAILPDDYGCARPVRGRYFHKDKGHWIKAKWQRNGYKKHSGHGPSPHDICFEVNRKEPVFTKYMVKALCEYEMEVRAASWMEAELTAKSEPLSKWTPAGSFDILSTTVIEGE